MDFFEEETNSKITADLYFFILSQSNTVGSFTCEFAKKEIVDYEQLQGFQNFWQQNTLYFSILFHELTKYLHEH